jgi:hypothetical protein
MNEIKTFKTDSKDPLLLLRFKAAIERGLRMANDFTQDIIDTFQL